MRPLIADARLPPAPCSPRLSEAPPLAGGPAPPLPVGPTLLGPGPLPPVESSTSHAHVPASSGALCSQGLAPPKAVARLAAPHQRTWGLSVKPGAELGGEGTS